MNRRAMLIATTAAAPCFLLSGRIRAAQAGQLTPLDDTNPAAQALHYADDASSVDASLRASDSDHNCSNCLHWQGGDASRGGCALFPGFSVAAAGWCSGWVAQAQP